MNRCLLVCLCCFLVRFLFAVPLPDLKQAITRHYIASPRKAARAASQFFRPTAKQTNTRHTYAACPLLFLGPPLGDGQRGFASVGYVRVWPAHCFSGRLRDPRGPCAPFFLSSVIFPFFPLLGGQEALAPTAAATGRQRGCFI